MPSLRTAVLLLTVALTAAACGSSDTRPVLTIGAGDSPQSTVLAEIYAQALSRTGARTTVAPALGDRKALLAALDSNTVAVTPEVNGDLLTALDSSASARKPDAVTTALYAALPEGLAVSDPADGTDLRPTVAIAAARTPEFPSTLKDLAPRCPDLTVGIAIGPALDAMRAPLDPHRDVLDPLHTVYACDLPQPVTYPTDADLRKAVLSHEIQLAVFSGPPAFLPDGSSGLVSLADPVYALRAADILALIRKGALTADQLRKLNYVSGELGTTELADMIHQVRDNHAIPASVARTWLDAHAL
ncbi:glycine betaine ABC transporter substrate-binding protein [Nocardia inohanensis]|uniref:glycine betaine ABC transporter substrate-binding protein n=1 Tax=Nocardia inohanensis TaxID=209246 RepID=UPI0012F8D3CC|nr:glycine betaine ABC transporter substrate-binding protein [Nocardia inohanensis]